MYKVFYILSSTYNNGLLMASVAENVRTARRAKSLTQQELAAKVGVTRVTVANWERGATNPSYEDIERMAAALDSTPDALRYGAQRLRTEDIQRPLPRVANSHRVRVWIADFQAELTRAGATEDEIAEAMDLMRAPQVFTFYAGGAPKEFSEEDAIMGMEAIALVVRSELKKRGRKFPK